jgi:hypothetical protein
MRPGHTSEALKADSAEHWKKELQTIATKNNDCKKEAKDLQSRTLEEREHQTPHKQLITCSACLQGNSPYVSLKALARVPAVLQPGREENPLQKVVRPVDTHWAPNGKRRCLIRNGSLTVAA